MFMYAAYFSAREDAHVHYPVYPEAAEATNNSDLTNAQIELK